MMNSAISKVPPAAEWVQGLGRAGEVAQGPPAAADAPQVVTDDTAVQSAHLMLGRGQHVWLRADLATRLTCVNGVAWITFERCTEDLVLLPGESFVVAAKTAVLIGPLQGSTHLDARGAFEIMGREESPLATVSNWH